MKLRTKFMSIALPGLLIFFIIGIIIILEKEKRDFIDQGKEKASLFASSVETSLLINMLEGEPDHTADLLKDLRKMEAVYKKIEFNRWGLIIASIPLALTIAFLSAFFIRKVILKPIDILSEGVENLGKGNLDHRMEISGSDELKDLAISFNDMAGRLKESYSSLEDKIEERTKKLALLSYELNQIATLSTAVFRGNLSVKEIFISFIDVIIHNLGYYGAIIYLIDKENKTLKAVHYKRMSLGESGFPDVVPLKGEHSLSKLALGGKTTILNNNTWFSEEGSTLALFPILSGAGKQCWEEVGCTITECPAYRNQDLRCWLIEETRCCSLVWEKAEKGKPPEVNKIEKCILCPQFPLMGILGVSSLTTFSEDSLYTLEILASEISAAIENADLIEKINKDKALIEGVFFRMNSGLMLLDMNGIIQKINLVGSQILKQKINELQGMPLIEMFPGSEEFLEVDAGISREFDLRLRDGSVVPIGFNNSYLYSASEKPVGIIIVFRDMTEIKSLQNKLKEKERFATIGRIAAGVAHEIRNPLSGISSVAQILKKEIKGNPAHKEAGI